MFGYITVSRAYLRGLRTSLGMATARAATAEQALEVATVNLMEAQATVQRVENVLTRDAARGYQTAMVSDLRTALDGHRG